MNSHQRRVAFRKAVREIQAYQRREEQAICEAYAVAVIPKLLADLQRILAQHDSREVDLP